MRLDISRAADAARRAFERRRPALGSALRSGAGKLAGLTIGAIGGAWYGALVGLALGAMLDGARRRHRLARPEGEPGEAAGDVSIPDKAEAAATLGVEVDAPPHAIKRAFRAISKESHPDGPRPDSERFMTARKAYETLISSPASVRSGPRAT